MNFVMASAYGCAPLPPSQDKWDVWLRHSGPAIIHTIKVLCSLGHDLQNAKTLARNVPCCIKINVDLPTANAIRDQLEAVGAIAELR